MIQLALKELSYSPYLYINPETNVVHLLLPIMSSTQDADMEIGLDNTCKSVYSLQEFFGYAGSNRQREALGALRSYQEALEYDLMLPLDEALRADKTSRLAQIKTYINILSRVQKEESILGVLKQGFPSYPEPLERLMSHASSNLHTIILRPAEQDSYLRTTAITPDFSLPHSRLVNGQRVEQPSKLYDALRERYKDLSLKAQSKADILMSRVLLKSQEKLLDFEELQALLTQEAKVYLGQDIDFNNSEPKRLSPSVALTQAYVNGQLGDEAATNEEYLTYLVHACTEYLFGLPESSPFYSTDSPERLSILTQLFLAELNIACRIDGLCDKDFGKILEQNRDLCQALAETLRHAVVQHDSVEDALFAWVDRNLAAFGLKNPIPRDHQILIKQRFNLHYQRIQASPHFDEFMLLDANKPGLFLTHQGMISLPFVDFVHEGAFPLSKEEQGFVQACQKDFKTVPKPKNQLPHKNEGIGEHVQVEVDLKSLKPDAIERLYEASPQEVQAEILKEYPELVEKKLIKQFLQHVAYGQQDEAELILKQNPALSQKLLTEHTIPFTDYSGRTFTCTAYEYAYWACDSHMRWMLEKHILTDEETRTFIYQRVNHMTALVPEASSSSSTFFPAQSKPRGLHYTQQGTSHHSLHFDFQLLINELDDYVTKFDKRNWDERDEAWQKKVGGAQREVPAHLAQEYCHPDRNFEQLSQDNGLLKEKSFKRQMKFYNYDTGSSDAWFPLRQDSGLGFSVGILRGAARARGWRVDGVGCGWAARVDLSAVKAIEEVRIVELKQSLECLSRPLSAPDSGLA